MPHFTTRTRIETLKNKTFDNTSTLGAVVVTASPTGDGALQWIYNSLTNSQVLALRATPATLVPAPSAGFVLHFVSLHLFFDYTAAYTESSANLAVKYKDGSGTAASEAIEATGFADATADTMTTGRPKLDVIAAKTACDAQPLVLHNTGGGEWGGGNAANVLRFQIAYRVLPAGW